MKIAFSPCVPWEIQDGFIQGFLKGTHIRGDMRSEGYGRTEMAERLPITGRDDALLSFGPAFCGQTRIDLFELSQWMAIGLTIICTAPLRRAGPSTNMNSLDAILDQFAGLHVFKDVDPVLRDQDLMHGKDAFAAFSKGTASSPQVSAPTATMPISARYSAPELPSPGSTET